MTAVEVDTDVWAVDVPPYPRTGQWRDHRWISLRGLSEVPLAVAHAKGER
ncbi:hypothetical protein [Micromonospora sp. NPDC048839]